MRIIQGGKNKSTRTFENFEANVSLGSNRTNFHDKKGDFEA